uniref:Protein-serine/threonine phosphatase n=1 Tax=Bursaphelenchus xylophilus TaxID=6326 RepID=A0A1I7SFW6_BURXY
MVALRNVKGQLLRQDLLQTGANALSESLLKILIAIADSINVPIEEVLVEDDVNQDGNLVLGTVDGNNVSGLLRYVHEGIVDTIAYPIQKTIVRSQYMDFSEALYQSELNILRRRVDISEESLWSFFTIYDKPSYVVMAVILSLQALFYLINEFCAEELQRIGFRHIRAMRRHSEVCGEGKK